MRIIDADKYRKELLSAYDDCSMELEVLDRQSLVSAIHIIEGATNVDYIERSKIDKAIEEIKGLIKGSKLPTVNIYNSYSEGLEDCLEILKRNIGESEWKRQ